MAKVTAFAAVARLVPEDAQRSDDIRRAVERLRELQQRIRRRSKAKLSNREVRSAIDGAGCDASFRRDASVAVRWVRT
jgi:hypothetical protein